MAHSLTDDGTMDTVIKCDECGHETRFNYDGPGDGLADGGTPYTDAECEQMYDEYVAECIAECDADGCAMCDRHTPDFEV